MMNSLAFSRAGVLTLALFAAACSSANQDPRPAADNPTAVTAANDLTVTNGKARVGVPSFKCEDVQITACDVEQLYGRVLGRQADRNGLNTWLAAARAQGLNYVRQQLANSQESRDNINRLSQVLISRPATEDEISYAAWTLASGRATLYEVAAKQVATRAGSTAAVKAAFERIEQVPVGRL